VNQGVRLLIMGLLCLSVLQLAGCAPGQTRPVDETGDLGVEADASAADIYVKLAVAYMQEGQLDNALKKVRRGLQLDPNNASAHNVIALLYERLGETALAEEHYRRAVKLGPQDPYIHNAYGSFLCTQKRFEAADQEFILALRNPLYETPEVALTNAGVCAERSGQAEQAETYFRKALQTNPQFPVALLRMARISFEKGSYLSSRGYLQRYLEVAKHTAETLWLGIRTERELGDRDTVASYEMLLRAKFPDSEEMRQLEESRGR
jgi:type IV pilus assembly protein PilF